MSDKPYHIFQTLYTEVRSGSVWLYEKYETRLIKIKYVSNNKTKTIVVSSRWIDPNFNAVYKKQKNKETQDLPKDALLIEEYYRKKLGIEEDYRKNLSTKEPTYVKLNITPTDAIADRIRYLRGHPNDSIMITTNLAIVSIAIGLISILLSILLSPHILAHIVYGIQLMLC